MNKRSRIFCANVRPALVVLLIGGCSNTQFASAPAPLQARAGCTPPPQYHQVQRGENLFRIGWQHCLRYQDIAVWNQLDSPDRILAGQRLRLWPPGSSGFSGPAMQPAVASTAGPEPEPEAPAEVTAVAEPPVSSKPSVPGRKGWDWPSQGRIVSGFNPSVPGRNGIRISGHEGQVVKAAFPGQIVYTGSSLPGYGTLIIVQHSGGLLSAYGYLGKLYVKEGDKVEKGQTIAELGAGNDNRAALHFEIRKDGQPVNPLRYLPS